MTTKKANTPAVEIRGEAKEPLATGSEISIPEPIDAHRKELLEAAISWAERGWRILPCIPTGPKAKAPYLSGGFHDASADPDQIKQWWAQWPDAMLGIAIPPNVLVIDCDPRNGGTLEALKTALLAVDPAATLPTTFTVTSGRGDGGAHLYFAVPPGQRFVSRGLPKGIDLKPGGKGYVIAPPSLHPETGLPYRVAVNAPIAVLPAPVLRLLNEAPSARRRPGNWPRSANPHAFVGLVRTVASALIGERDNMLNWAAHVAAMDGAPEQVFDALADAARSAGLSPDEIAATINSARKAVTI